MKSKAPLALMEQIIMIAVFAFAAAICLKANVTAWNQSNLLARQDASLAIAQDIAEKFKARENDYMAPSVGWLDEDANPAQGDSAKYRISIEPIPVETDLLSGIQISVTDPDGKTEYAAIAAYRQEDPDAEGK